MKKYLLAGCLILAMIIGTSTNMNAQTKKRTSLNHIALYVVNLERSTAFYKDVVQLETMEEPFKDGRHSWFKVGEHSQLHIISGVATATTHDKNTHLCFSVPSMKDFIAVLNQHQLPFEDWPGKANTINKRVDGVQQIYLRDPDGYWIEINDDTY
ncbi:MAG TPA: VOC family protein [Chitinophaga sp.]|uniref:VOC family protein n=1 Tax=Chitinophaga sp. TaxID=1869181 RepID=UPI002CF7662C|nr:VOC family protein [Chitinophaga sp.]HVI46761.1 VOC family protein [Chitinophaga sp.]